MIRDLTIRGYSPNTHRSYINWVYDLAKFYLKSPDQLSEEQIQSYLFYVATERSASWSTLNVAVSALRFFYGTMLKRPRSEVDLTIPRARTGQRLPCALSTEEVEALFEFCGNRKHRVLLMTAYGAGLRVSELVRLLPRHLDAKREQLRVEQGKGRKDRYTLLSPRLVEELRTYWEKYRPQTWLFEGRTPGQHLSEGSAQMIYRKWATKAGITKAGGIHILRHSFASHLVENGMDLPVVQRLLGHRNLCTTAVYLHVSRNLKDKWRSPLDLLNPQLPRSFNQEG